MGKNSKELVNGPIVAVRLEGKIDGDNRIMYLFGDIHLDMNEETKCDSFTSIDYTKYFIETMEKTDKNVQYDFFMEKYFDKPMFESLEQYFFLKKNRRENYISSLINFIDKDTNISRKDGDVINSGSKIFKNLRYHFLDIRYLLQLNFFYGFGIYQKPDDEKTFVEHKVRNLSLHKFLRMLWDNILDIFYGKKEEKKYMVINYDYPKEIEDMVSNEMKDIDEKTMRRYLGKIVKITKKKNKKILLQSLIMKNALKNIVKSMKIIKKNLKIINDADRKKYDNYKLIKINDKYDHDYNDDFNKYKNIIEEIKNNNLILDDCFLNINSNLTDMYMLRRILEKKYIGNTIVYSGSFHTCNYILFLVKYYDFKITHTDYSKIEFDDLNNKIKKINDPYELRELLEKPELNQCFDPSKFPDLFM